MGRQTVTAAPTLLVMKGLLTVAEVAEMLRVSTMTVYRLIRSGEIPAVRIGRSYRIREPDLESYIESQIVETGD
jgi:excisionase family DNA binding protein